jgi:ankyrin repeat protein
MKFLSIFNLVFVLLFVAPLCATIEGVSEQRDPVVENNLNKKLVSACSKNLTDESLIEIEQLLAQGADANIVKKNLTPLYIAVHQGCVELVRMLLGAGAQVDAGTPEGFTPLFLAVEHGHTEIVRMLLAAGAQVNKIAHNGATPLRHAIVKNYVGIAPLLIDAGVDVNAAKNGVETPLHLAALKGRVTMAEQLIVSGARIHVTDNLGRTALSHAQAHQHQDVVDILEEINAFFANPAVTIEILKQLPSQEKWQEIMLLLGASISQGKEDLVAMLMEVEPGFKSALKQQAYAVAKRIGNFPIANKMFTLRELAKKRVETLAK